MRSGDHETISSAANTLVEESKAIIKNTMMFSEISESVSYHEALQMTAIEQALFGEVMKDLSKARNAARDRASKQR